MEKMIDLYEDDRTREKLLQNGAAALQDYELMAVMLGSSVQGKDIVALSKEIVSLIESDFDMLDLDRLASIHGMEQAKAAQILASVELSRRHLLKQNVKVTSAEDVSELLREYALKKQEQLIVLTVDGASRLIEKRVIMTGRLNRGFIHPRVVFEGALTDRAAGIFVAHINPYGEPAATPKDLQVAQRLKEIGKLEGIELIDHVIVTRKGFLSLKEAGIL